MGRRTWTSEQEIRLRKLYPCTDMLELERIFKRSACAINSRARRLKIKRSNDFVKIPRNSPWRNVDMVRFVELYPDLSDDKLAQYFDLTEPAVAGKAQKLGLRKNPERKRIGQFHNGHTPWNKGKKGVNIGGRETQYKKGMLPHNTKHDGCISIRNDKSGNKYKWIRLSLANWRMYHVYLWEQHYGPVPKGKIVVFVNKNTLDVRIGNLMLISRGEHMRRNHNREKFRKLVEIEKTRLAYGMEPKSGLGRHWMNLRRSNKKVIAINTKPVSVELAQ